MVLRGAEGRFSVGAVLAIRVAIQAVEEGNQTVSRVENSLRCVLDLLPDFSRGKRW